MLYRFIGDTALLHEEGKDIYFSRFGQAVELTDQQIKAAPRIPLIRDADFERFGFTADELKLYPTAHDEARAPQAFLEKKSAAIAFFLKESTAQIEPAQEPSHA